MTELEDIIKGMHSELRELNKWQKIQTLLLGAIAAAVGVNLGVA